MNYREKTASISQISLFLDMSIRSELNTLSEAVEQLQDHFQHSLTQSCDLEEVSVVLKEVADRLENNYPYFDELYAGQMLKPPHPVARLAYMLALYINPNNHALDGGRASSQMEKEAVAKIAEMFGWTEHLGHLTGGGTMANMEALWVAAKEHPGKAVAASTMAHYTHQRLTDVLSIPFRSIPSNANGSMDIVALESALKQGDIGTVVVTLGTTGTGSVDDLESIISLQQQYAFRIHIDAAYGGYFRLAGNLSQYTQRQFDLMQQADSIVIDPHKHGLQPYGCGCIVFKNPAVGRYYQHDSPYTYFSSAELHLGEISLECSRAGAAAVALWATLQMFPLERNSTFAQGLEHCHDAALQLSRHITDSNHSLLVLEPELDLVVWAPTGSTFSEVSRRSTEIFHHCADKGVHLALFKYPAAQLSEAFDGMERDQDYVTCLRSCLMKHNHQQWVSEIWNTIDKVTLELLN